MDVRQKKVTVTGRVDPNKKMQRIRLMAANDEKRKPVEVDGLGGEGYSTHLQKQKQYRLKKVIDNLIEWACCFR